MNLTKQPLPLSLLTLVGLVALAHYLPVGGGVPGADAAWSTPLAVWLSSWQGSYPILSAVLSSLLLFLEALMIARIGTRHGLYSGGSLIAMPLYALLAVGLFMPADSLVGVVAALLFVRALRNLSASMRNGLSFTPLFRGALYLGTLPLLLPPAVLLLPLGVIALALFKRTLREGIVLLVGLLLPLFAASYLAWAFGEAFEAPVRQIATILHDGSALHLFRGASPIFIVQLMLLFSASLCALFYFQSSRYHSSSKARAILTLFSWSYLLSVGMLLLPGASFNLFMLIAVSTTLLLPYLFVRLRPLFANLLYVALLLCFFVRLFF